MKITDLTNTLPIHKTKTPKIRSLNKIKRLIVHTSDWNITPDALAKYDIGPNHISSTGCPSITYHYTIDKAGEVSRTAPEGWVLWHAGLHNSDTIAVALLYKTDPDFESGKKVSTDDKFLPTAEQEAKLIDLIVHLCKKFKIAPSNVLGHRELIGTGFVLVKGHKKLRKTCPGRGVNLDLLRRRVTLGLQVELGVKADGIWGPVSQAALDHQGG